MEKISDWDIKDYDHATEIAAQQTKETGRLYLPVDKGRWTSPQYGTVEAPEIGDKVSYAFNGDYYPSGTIVKVSESRRRVVTDKGDIFYRMKNSSTWKLQGSGFYMVKGVHDRRNPHF